jgi:hypothetical protein
MNDKLHVSSDQPFGASHGAAAPPPLPPPLGQPRPAGPPAGPRPEDLGGGYVPLADPITAAKVLDSLLKLPGQITHEIVEGRAGRISVVLFAVATLSLLLYGAIMGSFVGGQQLWMAPVKVLFGALVSALICLPSLYILVSLSGGRQSLPQTAGLFLQALALNGLLLVGFAPIAWVFSQATETTVFMGALHLIIWVTAVWFSLSVLLRAFSFLNRRAMGAVRFWGVIFFVVLLQMSTTVRPLIGQGSVFRTTGKKFFLAHWGDCLRHPKP